MKHIVIVTPTFAVNEQDTITLPFLQLYCKELVKNNILLTIITEQYPLHKNFRWNGITVFTLKRTRPKLAWKFMRRYVLTKTLRKIHSEQKIDIIHNFWFNILGIISEKFALKNKIKLVTTLTGQDVLPSNPFFYRIKNYTGKLICVSQFHKNKLEENLKISSLIIEWGIEDIQASKQERTIDLIICGWINSVKNHSHFLEIVSELQKTRTLKKVVICGGGPLFNELVKNIEQKQLQDLIEIKNSIPREQVIELMQQSKILVHTSDFESFGLVLAEGLSCGCAVISKPVGVAFDNDKIIKCQTTPEFVSAIKKELEDWRNPEIQTINTYPIERTVLEYLTVYSHL